MELTAVLQDCDFSSIGLCGDCDRLGWGFDVPPCDLGCAGWTLGLVVQCRRCLNVVGVDGYRPRIVQIQCIRGPYSLGFMVQNKCLAMVVFEHQSLGLLGLVQNGLSQLAKGGERYGFEPVPWLCGRVSRIAG